MAIILSKINWSISLPVAAEGIKPFAGGNFQSWARGEKHVIMDLIPLARPHHCLLTTKSSRMYKIGILPSGIDA